MRLLPDRGFVKNTQHGGSHVHIYNIVLINYKFPRFCFTLAWRIFSCSHIPSRILYVHLQFFVELPEEYYKYVTMFNN